MNATTIVRRTGQMNIGAAVHAVSLENANNGPGDCAIIDVIPGTYNCYAVIKDEGNGNPFVSELAVIRDSEPEWDGIPNEFLDRIDSVYVNDGTAGFFADGFMMTAEDETRFLKNLETGGEPYILTQESFVCNCLNGVYPIYAKQLNNDVAVGLVISFE